MQGTLGIMSTMVSAGTAHEHTIAMATMVAQQINGGMMVTFNTTGTHDHMVTLTAAQAMMLASGGTVTGVISASGGTPAHTHTYTIDCA
jgi:hypothetical protein